MILDKPKIPAEISKEEMEMWLRDGQDETARKEAVKAALYPIESIIFRMFQLAKDENISARILRAKIKKLAKQLSVLEYGNGHKEGKIKPTFNPPEWG